ncbi:MAG: M23 family metallopeptidase [Spirochaetales bacterium]|nr:M23 family metallopeptidase [Spirochaetales bacterium]
MSYNRITSAINGIDAFKTQQEIRMYETFGNTDFAENYEGIRKAGTALRSNYSFGYEAAQSQLSAILNGTAQLRVGYASDTEKGQTVLLDGSRQINLSSLGSSDSLASRLVAGVVLQHEASRDGIIGTESEQKAETFLAVKAHTEMALRMANSGYGVDFINSDSNLLADVKNYVNGEDAFSNYVDSSYDSSADYWKLMDNGDLVEDGDGWLRDQNGNLIKDKDGNPIGAEGIETGLLNILHGGTSNKAYSDFSDAEIQAAQKLMIDAGFSPTEVENFKDRMWNSGNDGKTIKAGSTLNGFGNTVATSVFMNGMDKATDTILFSNNNGSIAQALGNVPLIAAERFMQYLGAKAGFYGGDHNLFDSSTLEKMRISGQFGPDSAYPDGQHKGIDFASIKDENDARKYDLTGSDMYAFFGGKVIKNYNSASAGNSVIIENGFNFEGYFYDIGVRSQYMHLDGLSSLDPNSMVTAGSLVGQLGSTGMSTGPHLHWQLMGDQAGYRPTSDNWDMYSDRRDTFLNFLGIPSTSSWSDTPTSTNNYWADKKQYMNFYYNTNSVYQSMGLFYE